VATVRRNVLAVLSLAALGCRGVYAPELAGGATENETSDPSSSTDGDTHSSLDSSETPDTDDAETDETDDTDESPETNESPDTSETDPMCGADELEIGGGCLGFRESAGGASMPVDIVLIDASGDPNLDVIVADQAGPPRLYPSIGGLISGDGTTFTVKIVTSLARFDVDVDGQLDLAAGGAESVTIFRPLGGGGFVEETSLLLSSVTDVAAGFLDGDRAADLAISASGSPVNVVLNQLGSFQVADMLLSGDPGNLAIGDFDGDTDSDVAFVELMSSTVVVFANNGGFDYATSVEFSSVFGLAAADLDDDGDDELLATNPEHGTLTIIDLDGSLAAQTSSYPVGQTPRQVAVGDIDGDGVPDAVTANRLSNDVSILLGDGNGGFAAPLSIAALPGTMQAESIALGDLDGDGRDEIIVGGLATGHITVFGY